MCQELFTLIIIPSVDLNVTLVIQLETQLPSGKGVSILSTMVALGLAQRLELRHVDDCGKEGPIRWSYAEGPQLENSGPTVSSKLTWLRGPAASEYP